MADQSTIYDSSFLGEIQTSQLSSVSVGSDSDMYSIGVYVHGNVLDCTVVTYNRALINVILSYYKLRTTTKFSSPYPSPSPTPHPTPPLTSWTESPNAEKSKSSHQASCSIPPSPFNKSPTNPDKTFQSSIMPFQCPVATCLHLSMRAVRRKSMARGWGFSFWGIFKSKGKSLLSPKAYWIKFAHSYHFTCSCGSRCFSLWFCPLLDGCSRPNCTMPSVIRPKLK